MGLNLKNNNQRRARPKKKKKDWRKYLNLTLKVHPKKPKKLTNNTLELKTQPITKQSNTKTRKKSITGDNIQTQKKYIKTTTINEKFNLKGLPLTCTKDT